MQPYYIALKDDNNNLHHKAITPPGCLERLKERAGQLLRPVLWVAAGMIIGYVVGVMS